MAEQQDGEREPQPIDEEAAWAAIVAGYGEEPADPPGARPFRPVENLALPDMPEDAEPADGDHRRAAGGAARTGSGGAVAGGAGAAASDGPAEGQADGPASGPVKDPADGPADGPVKPDAADKPDKFRKREEPGGPAEPEGPGEDDRPALGSSIVFAPGVGVGGGGPRDYSLAEPDEGDGEGGGGDEGHFVPPEPPPLPEADATTKFAWLGVIGGPVLMLFAVLFRWDMTWWLTTLCVGGFLGGFVTLVARMKHDDEDDDGFDDPGRGAVV
ncbi:hypothetical protein ABZ135_14185 [Streptomyces sp. NPDC006339]|uniref:hypothetical protein n=1 Tax=Streptomyces sp. NPDC006339 TaxID=3156755 RepID=UPI0033A34524